MTRVFNDATSFKEKMIEDFVAAYGRFVRCVPNASGVVAVGAQTPGKVSVVIGGGSGTADAWSRALPASIEGAEATSEMVSAKGRSSKLGERSRGHKDPGAASMVLILGAAGGALGAAGSST